MNYKVTLLVSELGFKLNVALVILVTIGAFASKGVTAGLAGFCLSMVLSIPFMMFCEGMHALVTIANNTKKPQDTAAKLKEAA